MSLYNVRTTHGKTRLRATRSFGPAAVAVELNAAEAALVLADPFLEAVLVEAVRVEPVLVEAVRVEAAVRAAPLDVRPEPVEAALPRAKPTKKTKA